VTEVDDIEPDPVALAQAMESSPEFAELRRRCEAANLELVGEQTADEAWWGFHLPRAGRDEKLVWFQSVDTVAQLLTFAFERVHFIGGYDAVAYYEDGSIEAAVRQTGGIPNMRSRFFGRRYPDLVDADGSARIQLADGLHASGVSAEISASSDQFLALVRGSVRNRYSLKIRGVDVKRHDTAITALETISDAIFFDLDHARNLALDLSRTRRGARRSSTARQSSAPLRLPVNRYDHQAASLYRYAREAQGMPLLQFLGYYQVIEFYMPRFTQAETRRRIENVVKDPTFDPHSAGDISRIISATKASVGAERNRDERTQLKVTLRECVDIVDLERFLDHPERREFFARKSSPLTRYRVSVRDGNTDLRDQVAERIYDLRCKIVHTKDSNTDQVDLLLPNSTEAEMLQDDIELLRLLASQILVAASRPLAYRFT